MYLREAFSLIGQYVRKRISEQFKSVLFIIVYMICFQTLVLGIGIQDSIKIGSGLCLVVIGLTLFMEGIVLGLMPLGETIGLKLPRKSPLIFVILFAFALGIAATFAEPAIGVLRAAGRDVKAWEAPLLFRILTVETDLLVYTVAGGVGIAVAAGILRFIYQISLKPFLLVIVGTLSGLTLYAAFDPKLASILGLAWDCGAVTTGPVTVPLVLALGIGICRVTSSDKADLGGFGIVTLASLLPVLSVLLLSVTLAPSTPHSMAKEDFLNPANQSNVERLFNSSKEYTSYRDRFIHSQENPKLTLQKHEPSIFIQSFQSAIQAIIPLCLGMFLVLWIIREKLLNSDEIILGVILAVLGMAIFNIGINFGLDNLGRQVGTALPSSYEKITLKDHITIPNFDPTMVQKSVDSRGVQHQFFFHKDGDRLESIDYDKESLNRDSMVYTYRPTLGPLFGNQRYRLGTVVVLAFAFLMGFGATLAEPALNALGTTVENLTAGSFKKSLLMKSVAVGVGLGLSFGVAKIIWDIPIALLLLIPYAVVLILTHFATEELVNIAWDSAGVTTGPITVPLVIAMGLGISSQSPVVEGFGILALASIGPILMVLSIGLIIQGKQNNAAGPNFVDTRQSIAEGDENQDITGKQAS